ncbi:MAG TPA: hypothetical protein VJ890_01895 [Vineibacter sp.]|nr:hypothetical protein [Vineibacter sp.]
MEGYFEFRGKYSDNGSEVELSGDGGNGRVTLVANDVKIANGIAYIRDGAIAKSPMMPTAIDSSNKPAAHVMSGKCKSGRTYCIGLVMFCCDNDAVIGACIGAWDCS